MVHAVSSPRLLKTMQARRHNVSYSMAKKCPNCNSFVSKDDVCKNCDSKTNEDSELKEITSANVEETIINDNVEEAPKLIKKCSNCNSFISEEGACKI